MPGETIERAAESADAAPETVATEKSPEAIEDAHEAPETEEAPDIGRVQILEDCSVQIGRGDGKIETVVYPAGSVFEIPAEQARLFVGNGRAQFTDKKVSRKR